MKLAGQIWNRLAHSTTAVFLAMQSESGEQTGVELLPAKLNEKGKPTEEKLLTITRSDKGGARESVVEIEADGTQHFGEGHDEDSAAKYLWAVVVHILPELRERKLEGRL